MNTKRLRLLLIPAVIIVIACIYSFINNDVSGINADEWINKSFYYMDNANKFIENMDNTLTLYFSRLTNEESYNSDYKLIKKQWKVIRSDFNNFCHDNPVLPDTQTAVSQLGYDGIISFYNEIDSLFDEMDSIESSNSKHLSYVYLAHQQNLVKHYSTYIITYNLMNNIYDATND